MVERVGSLGDVESLSDDWGEEGEREEGGRKDCHVSFLSDYLQV